MKKSLLSLVALLMAGTAFAQVNFTFNRTNDTSVEVSVSKNGELSNEVSATLTFSGSTTLQNQSTVPAGAISINRNTNAATANDPNKYTLTITNNSEGDLTFDYIKVSGIALTGGGGYQGPSVYRTRNFMVEYGGNSLSSVEKIICDGSHHSGTWVNNLFDVTETQRIEAGATYEVSVSIDNTGILADPNGLGCFYGLTEIALINTHTLTVGTSGYATLMLGYNATIPADATCYAAAVEGDKAKLTAIEGALAANTPVLVQATEGDYVFEPVDYASAVEGNELAGSLSAKDITPATSTICYVLAQPEGKDVAFYQVEMDGVKFACKANKAYLPVTASVAPARINFDFGTETGIAETESGNLKTEMYDLSGRRVQSAQKGIFIVNGKKVIK